MMIHHHNSDASSATDLSSFDDMLSSHRSTQTTTTLMGHKVCSSALCFAVEGFMTTLFTPPSFANWSSSTKNNSKNNSNSNSNSNNSLVASENDYDNDRYSCYKQQNDFHYLYPSRTTTAATTTTTPEKPQSRQPTALSPRQVCKLWKTKRRLEKRKSKTHQQQQQQQEQQEQQLQDQVVRKHTSWQDQRTDVPGSVIPSDLYELQSKTKQTAQMIQRTYEKEVYDDDCRHYEKYGRRRPVAITSTAYY